MIIKKIFTAIFAAGCATTGIADVCTYMPGSVICSNGEVKQLSGNGMVNLSGTSINGVTAVNGALTASNARFATLQVNGSADLIQCVVKDTVDIKGSLSAKDTKFDNSVELYSNETKLVNSKIKGSLYIRHTENQPQKVYLDKSSVITGDIVFDDGNGELVLSDNSKIGGNIIGGNVVSK